MPKMLIVVSSDRRVKSAAKRRKATALDCVDFWTDVIKIFEKKRKNRLSLRENLSA